MAERAGRGRGWDEFAPLYDEYHQRLYRVAMLLCNGSTAAAEDAVAETFVSVYQVWCTREIEHFFGYARQALVNQVMGQYRRRKVAQRYVAMNAPPVADDDVGPEARAVDGSTAYGMLAQLPPRQRTAVVLRYYEDLTYEQIAATMAVSIGTAKAQVSVGLQKMRDLMTADAS